MASIYESFSIQNVSTKGPLTLSFTLDLVLISYSGTPLSVTLTLSVTVRVSQTVGSVNNADFQVVTHADFVFF